MIYLPLIIFTIFCILLFDIKMGTGGDNVIYIILSKSIVEYHNYLSLYLFNSPYHTHFPPGFPLILAIFYKFFGPNETYLKIVPLISSIFSFFLLTTIFRNFYFLLALSVSPLLIDYSSKLLSEPSYLLFSLLSIFFYTNQKFLLSSIFAGFTFLIRNAGISIIFSIVLDLILKRKFKLSVLSLIISSIFVLSWQLWTIFHKNPNETTYIQEFFYKNVYNPQLGYISISDFIFRILNNFLSYFLFIIPKSIINLESEFLLNIIGILILIGLLIGFLKEKNLGIMKIYSIFYLIVALSWPEVWTSDRFILPILPFILYFSLNSLNYLNKTIFKLICFFIFAFNFFLIIQRIPQNLNDWMLYKENPYSLYSPDWQKFFEAINYIKNNIPKDKIIVSRKPEFVYLIAGNKGKVYKFSYNVDSVFLSIKDCDYVILDNFFWTGTTQRYLLPVILKYKDKFQIVYQTDEPKTYVLKILK